LWLDARNEERSIPVNIKPFLRLLTVQALMQCQYGSLRILFSHNQNTIPRQLPLA